MSFLSISRGEMRMRIKKWYIWGALALGLMLGFLIQECVSSQPSGLIAVVVARADISAGTVLRPGYLEVIQWPREYLPANTAEKVQQVEGQIIMQPVTKGEPGLLPKLVKTVKRKVV